MRRRLAVWGVIVAAVGAGCSASDAQITQEPGRAVVRIPSQLVGLTVQQEDIGEGLVEIDRPYVDSVAVFSLREPDELLQATLQVSRFNSRARPNDAGFRGSIVSTVGSTKPQEIRVGDVMVSATSAASQEVFVWFTDDGFFVLSVSKDFPFPRTLLRRALNLELT